MNKVNTKYKEFNVDYLAILKTNENGENEPFDLVPYIKKCQQRAVAKRTVNYNGEVARLQKIIKLNSENIVLMDNLEKEENLWRLDFIRIKKFSMTGVADENGEYDEYYLAEKLNNNQYLADPTSCIYDGDLKIFIIARNRDGVLPSGILEFFKKVTNNKTLQYGILPTKTTFSKVNTNIYRNLAIGIDNIDKLENNSKSFLKTRCKTVFGALTSLAPFGNINLRLTLSMGQRPKGDGMHNQIVSEELQALIESNIENISKLSISSRADEDTKIEEIDLLQDKIHDKFKLGYSKKDLITHDRLYDALVQSYNKLYKLVHKIKV
ncbi:DUF6731 family protein [Clostridium botulinum]|uniref:DUF6731 family protein n=1 Tax=Clostridium botulinum TaxID=1491 RepID=UPI0006994B75|nr:DUF6731 family protein [Clostridium botulinum]KOA89591.1 hypothetical protein ADU76_14320 [Clostridium botulinum]MCD3203448.1 hypothetical protein [Clostridium botulinum C/D]MCD3222311.1 hypothetical protein [Clostridium botulinum C/D]MCD3231419.1 hypothetical protein [Clostridium botulinum C/D]MCD3273084.1 hypothetical protein [Clostridium botulinum C/D]